MNDVTYTTLLPLIGLLMVGCHSTKPIAQAPQAVQIQKLQSQSGAIDGVFRFSAVVMPDSQVPLAFRIPGYVTSLKQVRGQDGRMRDIAEGDHVGQGTVLAHMRAVEYEEKVRQAKSESEAADAAVQKAKLDYERATHLYKLESMTKPDFDAAQAQYDATQAHLRAAQATAAEAQVALRDTTLVAPFSGDVVKKTVEIGSYVGPGIPTLAIANTDIVKIVVGVPDTVLRSIKLGQSIDVAIDAFPTRKFNAHVSRIASAADTTTRNFDVEVAIPNRDHLLKAGMIGSLQLAQPGAADRVSTLVVPISAIVQANDGKYGVFTVSDSTSGTVARLHSVDIGTVNGTDITLVNGVAAGERIITTGANLLKDGQRVEVLQ